MSPSQPQEGRVGAAKTYTCSDPDDGDGLLDIRAWSAQQAAMWYAEECAKDQNYANMELDVTVTCADEPTTKWSVLVASCSAVRAELLSRATGEGL